MFKKFYVKGYDIKNYKYLFCYIYFVVRNSSLKKLGDIDI